MGEENSKIEGKEELKKIGEEANKSDPSEFCSFTPINFTNDLLVSEFKTDPEIDYKKLDLLGEGSFGSVYRVQNKYTEQIYAMKVINKSSPNSQGEEKEILNEVNILKIMDHPGILKIYEFYSNENSYSIINELCQGGDLFQHLVDKGPFDEKYTAFIMYQILSAMNYCHKNRIVHRDLKPENILIVDKHNNGYPIIKICDFGNSKLFPKGGISRQIVGTSYYIAPEVLKKSYNEKCDLWSCGVIMYILLSGRPPFEGEEDSDVMIKVLKGNYDITGPPFDKLSANAIDLLKQLLTLNYKDRISASHALKHQWFKDNESRDLFNKINSEETLETLINNLKNYKRTSIIQEIALAYLVHHFPQIKDVVNACKLFNQVDRSGDGKISKSEFFKGVKKIYNKPTLEKDVETIYNNLDMDKNVYLGYEEFVRAAVSKEYFVKDNVLKFAFRYLDKDNSGEISYDEIKQLFIKIINDKDKVDEILKWIIKEVDKNNDGKINFDEFSIVMKKMIK